MTGNKNIKQIKEKEKQDVKKPCFPPSSLSFFSFRFFFSRGKKNDFQEFKEIIYKAH